jgi:hypothetical protein
MLDPGLVTPLQKVRRCGRKPRNLGSSSRLTTPTICHIEKKGGAQDKA